MVRVKVRGTGQSLEDAIDRLRVNLQAVAREHNLPVPEGIAGAEAYRVSVRKPHRAYVDGDPAPYLDMALNNALDTAGLKLGSVEYQVGIRATYNLQKEGPTPSPAGPDYRSPRTRTILF